MPSPRLLVLSNGHGEDLIALRVLEALARRRPELTLQVLPLVGEGQAFAAAEATGLLQRLGPRRSLPSGGFSNQSLSGLRRDLAAGLAGLSLQQWRWVRRWGRGGERGSAAVLAVGDLLPLLLAWGSGAPFAFLGTPKSDYTWATPGPAGWPASPLADGYHRCKGSEWDPWEWRLMASRRCRLVAMRDGLTARGLQRRGIAALAPGNPMLDDLEHAALPGWLARRRRLLLLPGSRLPEALQNARRLLEALGDGPAAAPEATTVLVACGTRPTALEWDGLLQRLHWQPATLAVEAAAAGAVACWRRGALELLLGPGCFSRWAGWAEVGLATAGTATEQLVGLGVPALSLPGPGPQFKAGFARRQCRLLGGAVQPCHNGAELQRRLMELLQDPERRQALGAIGRRRMGAAGGSEALAALLETRLLSPSGPANQRLG